MHAVGNLANNKKNKNNRRVISSLIQKRYDGVDTLGAKIHDGVRTASHFSASGNCGQKAAQWLSVVIL